MAAGLGAERQSMQGKMLAKVDYYLDESDPDIVLLRRQDGAFAAAFSARGATREGIVEAAKEDYRRLLEANADPPWVFSKTTTESAALRAAAGEA
jgi:hypothetical protein